MTDQPVTLYGVPHSYYTARARSYLIKADIPYRELAPNTPHYLNTVVPLAGGRRSLPTVELPDGRVIRDSAAIIDHFERLSGHTFSPTGPKQRLVSHLVDVIGAEGLLRAAMHYRWHFDEENLEFVMYHFEMTTPPDDSGREQAKLVAGKMRKATIGAGAIAETREIIEQVYTAQLAALDRHFALYPYLLGGRPCIGDFGLMGPLFAHLGRDPKPLALMQAKGPRVLRWTERMNRRDSDLVGFENKDEAYLPDDAIPATLVDALRAFAEDFVPETLAAAQAINEGIAQQEPFEPGTPMARSLGTARFDVRGQAFSALAQPYRFYLLRRVQDDYAALGNADRAQIDAILETTGMAPLIEARLTRDIGQKDNREVWL